MIKEIPCPLGTACEASCQLCFGTHTLKMDGDKIVRPASACRFCAGEGYVARDGFEIIGAKCPHCGSVGDPEKAKAAVEAQMQEARRNPEPAIPFESRVDANGVPLATRGAGRVDE